MRILFGFLFLSMVFTSCFNSSKAKNINIDDINAPCDCVNSMLLVAIELNDFQEKTTFSQSDSVTVKELKKIMSLIDKKCLIIVDGLEKIKICDQFQKLQEEMHKYIPND